MFCPLCNTAQLVPITLKSFGREFIKCNHCSLIFSLADELPISTLEKSRYENHENSANDEGYVKFLNQAIAPVLAFLNSSSQILDYGCGPQPVLSQLLKQKGFSCKNYDPFFYPQKPTGENDVIFSTEVFEHFHYPKKEIEEITNLLVEGGLLVIMTEFYKDPEHFNKWWYTRDFTHVSFYNEDTFKHICKGFGYQLEYTDQIRVVILRKGKP